MQSVCVCDLFVQPAFHEAYIIFSEVPLAYSPSHLNKMHTMMKIHRHLQMPAGRLLEFRGNEQKSQLLVTFADAALPKSEE